MDGRKGRGSMSVRKSQHIGTEKGRGAERGEHSQSTERSSMKSDRCHIVIHEMGQVVIIAQFMRQESAKGIGRR